MVSFSALNLLFYILLYLLVKTLPRTHPNKNVPLTMFLLVRFVNLFWRPSLNVLVNYVNNCSPHKKIEIISHLYQAPSPCFSCRKLSEMKTVSRAFIRVDADVLITWRERDVSLVRIVPLLPDIHNIRFHLWKGKLEIS